MRTWARLLVLLLIAGVSLAPSLSGALTVIDDCKTLHAEISADCRLDVFTGVVSASDCSRGPVVEGSNESSVEDDCSALCACFCCPLRTIAPVVGRMAGATAESSLLMATDRTALPAGHVREIDHPPSR